MARDLRPSAGRPHGCLKPSDTASNHAACRGQRPAQTACLRGLAESTPIKEWTRIPLATRGDLGMTSDVAYRQAHAQHANQIGKAPILGHAERSAGVTFEFNADRMVIAAGSATITRHSGVPGPLSHRHELEQFALSPDKKMGRDPQPLEAGQRRMSAGIERTQEQPLDRVRSETPGGQTDGMDHDQFHPGVRRSGVGMGRWKNSGPAMPAIGTDPGWWPASMDRLESGLHCMPRRCMR